jgi:zinc transporter ZupT
VEELNRMIQAIGLMIGMYIITRMTELLMTQKKDQLLPLALRIFAGLTIGICVLGVLSLLGSHSPT